MMNAKRILAMVLALMMVLSLATTAFAAEEHGTDHSHTITIKNEHSGYEYVAYQIFSGTLASTGVMSDVKWGSAIAEDKIDDLMDALNDVPAFADCATVKDVVEVLSKTAAMDDPIAKDFADVVAQYVTVSAGTSEYDEDNEQYYIDGLADGYYLVVNTKVPDTHDTTYSRYILEVVRNITVTHKGTYPTVVKKIVEGEEKVDVNETSIGTPVYYEITGTLPSNISDYDTYYYVFTDTLSKGLTYNNDMKVTVNGVDVTDYFYKSATTYSETDGTTITAGIQDLLVLDNDTDPDTEGVQKLVTIDKNTKVVITYSATLNENAVIAGPNPNEVYLEYSNNPNVDGDPSVTPPPTPEEPDPEFPTGVTPKDVVETYTTELTIMKVDGQGKALEGAEFTLTGTSIKKLIVTKDIFTEADGTETDAVYYYKLSDGTYTTTAPVAPDEEAGELGNLDAYDPTCLDKKYTKETVTEVQEQTEEVSIKAFVGTDGFVTFSGLGAGVYTLTETVTPEGFNTIAPITFEVMFNETEKKFHCDDNSLIMVEADNTLLVEIINVAGNTLPSTGGIGTTLFYVFGSIMVFGAAVLLITKKRMASNF